mmetsp:Transcript_100834/g.284412  ORF Transcript_100834/g.284412 Transcript_100834/m.284412 type:complete len:213 (-) Transcript_100834:590-1228(-)
MASACISWALLSETFSSNVAFFSRSASSSRWTREVSSVAWSISRRASAFCCSRRSARSCVCRKRVMNSAYCWEAFWLDSVARSTSCRNCSVLASNCVHRLRCARRSVSAVSCLLRRSSYAVRRSVSSQAFERSASASVESRSRPSSASRRRFLSSSRSFRIRWRSRVMVSTAWRSSLNFLWETSSSPVILAFACCSWTRRSWAKERSVAPVP